MLVDRHARVASATCCSRSGFQLRIAPKGTLPFDTEATIRGCRASVIARCARARRDDGRARCSADSCTFRVPAVRDDHRDGARRRSGGAGRLRARRAGAQPAARERDRGERRDCSARDRRDASATRCHVAAGYDPQLRTFAGRAHADASSARALSSTWRREQRAVALPLATLQAMQGARRADRVSLFMVKAARRTQTSTACAQRIEARCRASPRSRRRRRCEQVDAAPELLPPARRHPRRGEPRRRIPARHDARDRLGERAHRRDRRHARDRRARGARIVAQIVLEGVGDHARPAPLSGSRSGS